MCDIIDKLLAKNAEDRYQSAEGLLADLRFCVQALCSSSSASGVSLPGKRVLANFEAGKVDKMSRFSVSQKLYGRDEEIALLRGALRRVVLEGMTEVFREKPTKQIAFSSVKL